MWKQGQTALTRGRVWRGAASSSVATVTVTAGCLDPGVKREAAKNVVKYQDGDPSQGAAPHLSLPLYTRAGNEGLRSFYNRGICPYYAKNTPVPYDLFSFLNESTSMPESRSHLINLC